MSWPKHQWPGLSCRQVLLGFFLTRVIFALIVLGINGWPGFIHDDTPSYVVSAQNLLHGSFARGGNPEIFRTPGYPLALLPAVSFRHFEAPALLENILLSTLCAWLIYRIARRLSPRPQVAAWAVMLYALEPLCLVYSEKLLTEPLFCAQILGLVWVMLHFFQKPGYPPLLAAALIAGSAAYTRPVAIFLGLALVPTLLLFPRMLPLRQRFSRALVFPLVFAATLVPWHLRNYVVAGYPGFSSVSDYNLFFYNAAAIEAKVEHKSFAELSDARLYWQSHPEQRNWTEAQQYLFLRKTANRILLRHPWASLLIHLKGCGVVLFDPGIMEVKVLRLLPERTGLVAQTQDRGPIVAMLMVVRAYPAAALVLALLEAWLLLYYFLAVRGAHDLPSEALFLLSSLVLYFVAVSGGPIAIARYRTPIMTLVCLPASLYIAAWVAGRKAALRPMPEASAIQLPAPAQ